MDKTQVKELHTATKLVVIVTGSAECRSLLYHIIDTVATVCMMQIRDSPHWNIKQAERRSWLKVSPLYYSHSIIAMTPGSANENDIIKASNRFTNIIALPWRIVSRVLIVRDCHTIARIRRKRIRPLVRAQYVYNPFKCWCITDIILNNTLVCRCNEMIVALVLN
jgi:hypothetical protein